jgi:hypothetical protein
MPTLQIAPNPGGLWTRPAIHRVETQNYNQRASEITEDLFRRLGQSTYLTVKYGLVDAEGALDRISAMEMGWDSYGAEPPAADAIRASKGILRQLATELILPSTIVPSAEGGVSLYFMKSQRTVYVESYNEGSQSLVMYDRDGSAEVLEIGQDIALSEVGKRILGYLG